MNQLTAKKYEYATDRISQCDIFKDIVVIESFTTSGNRLTTREINFPFVICLNQECDLVNDYNEHNKKEGNRLKDSALLHLAIAPLFIVDQFRLGEHWGEIFCSDRTNSEAIKKIKQNQTERYHYINFPPEDKFPEMVIDFKHFFTISRDILYGQISKRVCSLAPVYREKISQRFSYYVSRIGLP